VTVTGATEGPAAAEVGPPPPFDAELVPVLDAMAATPGPEFTLENIALIRAARSAVARPLTDEDLRRGGTFAVTSRLVPGLAGAPDVPLLICRPASVTAPAGCLYYIHGGGMIVGGNRTGLPSVLDHAEQLALTVVSVDYRLAPETPHPGPVEDCYAGLSWTVAHADELGIDPARVIVGGGSAGGGLSAAVALLARDRGGPDVSPYAAPARARDLAGLPPAFIDVGSAETFRDEDVAYATRIWQAGGSAELHVWPGGFHGFRGLVPGAALSRAAVAAQRDWLRRLLA
jgi:acetyl esterase/lipase